LPLQAAAALLPPPLPATYSVAAAAREQLTLSLIAQVTS